MGLDRNNKTPCGFCFVEYYTHQDALDCMKYIGGTKLDERIIRTDLDPGFQEGRQYGYVLERRCYDCGPLLILLIGEVSQEVKFVMNTVMNSILDEAVTVVQSMLNGRRRKRTTGKVGENWDSVLSAWRPALH